MTITRSDISPLKIGTAEPPMKIYSLGRSIGMVIETIP